jgi:hypothetical protein
MEGAYPCAKRMKIEAAETARMAKQIAKRGGTGGRWEGWLIDFDYT